MIDNVRVGNQILLLRKQNGFTQEELAEKLEISAQAISKWENGHTLPDTALLPLLAKLLHSTIDAILMPIVINVNVGDIIPFGDYKWRVLELKGRQALILTEHVIEQCAFHHVNEPITWESCDLRKYLNGEFYAKFSPQEQAQIIETKVTDRDNPWYGNAYGNDTLDMIFPLSYDEVVHYFGDSGHLKNRIGVDHGYGTQYGDAISDEYNYTRIALNLDGFNAWWWLRSPGGQHSHTTAGSVDGVIWMCGDGVRRKDGGIRPAMWIEL